MLALLLGFLLGGLGSIPPAGPVTALVLQRGAARRSFDGALVAIGATFGETLYCALAVFGYGHLMDRWPALQPIVHVAGIVILLGAGIYFLVLRHAPPDPQTPIPRSRSGSTRQLLLGFSLTTLNPSILINWSAVVAAMHSMGLAEFHRRDGLEFIAGAAVGILTWFTVLVMGLRHYHARFPFRALATALRVLGVVMIAAGVYSIYRMVR